MKYDSNIQENDPIIAYGVKGMKSRNFHKAFKNMEAMGVWLEKEADAGRDVTIETVVLDEGSKALQASKQKKFVVTSSTDGHLGVFSSKEVAELLENGLFGDLTVAQK